MKGNALKPFFLILSVCILSFASSVFAIELPEKLRDIPLFPNSKIQQVMDMENHAMATVSVKNTKPEAVADFYRKAMKDKGWKVTLQAQQEDSQMLQFQKGGELLHLNVQADDDETTIYSMVLQAK